MKVKIKTWDAMKEEFGLDAYSAIACTGRFVKEMEGKIPDDRIIEIKRKRYNNLHEWWIDGYSWVITPDMIEEIIDSNQCEIEFYPERDEEDTATGMSLRDYFAAKAMQAWIIKITNDEADDSDIAKWAYKTADAMLKVGSPC